MKPRRIALGLVLLAGGCGSGAVTITEDPVLGVVQQAARDHQGTQLQGGTQESAFVHLPVTGHPAATDPIAPDGSRFDAVSVRYGALSGTRGGVTYNDAALTGSVFHGVNQATGMPLQLTIVAAHARTTSVTGGTEYEFEVEVKDAAGVIQPLCTGPAGNRAVPAPGLWDIHGQHDGASSRFTFACLTGVVEKCVRWGYPYWKPEYEQLHQACTRMARADYCGTGTSHTVDGTLVDLYDLRGMEGDPDFLARSTTGPALAFEAAWTEKGPALCLSKLRWATLPLGGHCPLTLPDPRVTPMQKDPRARYCEDYGKVTDELNFLRTLSSDGAVVFNDSAYLDAGLYTWRHGTTNERYTTTDGSYEPARVTVSPETGYLHADYEGAVFRADLPSALRPADTVPLSSWYHPGRREYATTTGPRPAPGYVWKRLEGYVYSVKAVVPPGAKKLVRYRHGWTGDHRTSTTPPGLGWTPVRAEGFLPH